MFVMFFKYVQLSYITGICQQNPLVQSNILVFSCNSAVNTNKNLI